MHLRTILYFLAFPIVFFSMDAIRFDHYIKQGKVIQARLLYLVISLALSYLVVNFFMDFYTSTMISF